MSPGHLPRFPGTSIWEKTSGQTQNMLEGFHIPPDLEIPWDPPGGAQGHGWGQKKLIDVALNCKRKSLKQTGVLVTSVSSKNEEIKTMIPVQLHADF